LLLRDLSSSITNLQSAESLRQDTEAQLLRKKYGRPGGALWRWAGGGREEEEAGKSEEQLAAENSARMTRSVRESVLWFLRRKLEDAAEVQRGMVEKRIERVREKEKSVLYKVQQQQKQQQGKKPHAVQDVEQQQPLVDKPVYDTSAALSAADAAAIETQLSPAQLRLFAEENDTMLKQYEDALSKVQYVPVSLLPRKSKLTKFSSLKECGKITTGNILAAANPRRPPFHTRRIHQPASRRRIDNVAKRRPRKQRAAAGERAAQYGADGVLGYGLAVYVAGCLGCYFLDL
jgi:hypothetical protein